MTHIEDRAIADKIVAYHLENGLKLPSPSRLRKKVADYKRQIGRVAIDYTDPTGNEVATRESRSNMWKVENPLGYMATKGARPGLTDAEIAAADKEAQELAEAWRRA